MIGSRARRKIADRDGSRNAGSAPRERRPPELRPSRLFRLPGPDDDLRRGRGPRRAAPRGVPRAGREARDESGAPRPELLRLGDGLPRDPLARGGRGADPPRFPGGGRPPHPEPLRVGPPPDDRGVPGAPRSREDAGGEGGPLDEGLHAPLREAGGDGGAPQEGRRGRPLPSGPPVPRRSPGPARTPRTSPPSSTRRGRRAFPRGSCSRTGASTGTSSSPRSTCRSRRGTPSCRSSRSPTPSAARSSSSSRSRSAAGSPSSTRPPPRRSSSRRSAAEKPRLVLTVPLVLEKIYAKRVRPFLEKPVVKLLTKVPALRRKIDALLRKKLIDAFGGRVLEVVVGGAALNPVGGGVPPPDRLPGDGRLRHDRVRAAPDLRRLAGAQAAGSGPRRRRDGARRRLGRPGADARAR